MESLKELNKICQKPRYKEVGNWMVRYLLRDAAIPITWLLLHTPITANQVTLISLVVAIAGAFCLMGPGNFLFLLGVLLLQLWYLLDHVDGQIARYRKTASLSGRFFDFLTHHIIHGIIFFVLGVHSFMVTGSFVFVLWGFITALAMMVFNLSYDAKYKTFFEKIVSSSKTFKIKSFNPISEEDEREKTQPTKTTWFRKGFACLHKFCEIHVLMNLLTLMAILEFFIPVLNVDFRLLSHVFYGLAVPILAAVKISYLIGKQEIDREFERLFD